MVAIKPGAKTQKVLPKLRQSRLVLVKETPPTVDEAVRASLRLEEEVEAESRRQWGKVRSLVRVEGDGNCFFHCMALHSNCRAAEMRHISAAQWK